jgi:hypothetical protein
VYFTADDGIHCNELWAAAMPAIAGVELPNPAVRSGVALAQNAPNPFGRTSTIRYTLPASGRARLRLFDVTGREVRALVDEEQSAGEHVATLDASALHAGIYFYRLEAASVTVQRKTLVVR